MGERDWHLPSIEARRALWRAWWRRTLTEVLDDAAREVDSAGSTRTEPEPPTAA